MFSLSGFSSCDIFCVTLLRRTDSINTTRRARLCRYQILELESDDIDLSLASSLNVGRLTESKCLPVQYVLRAYYLVTSSSQRAHRTVRGFFPSDFASSLTSCKSGAFETCTLPRVISAVTSSSTCCCSRKSAVLNKT